MKPIQSSYVPIKSHEYLAYHQVGSCTLSHSRRDWTKDFCKSPSFDIPDPGPTEIILNIHRFFSRIFLKVDKLTGATAGSNFVQKLTPLKFYKRLPHWALFVFFGQQYHAATILYGLWVDFSACYLLWFFDFVRVLSLNTISIIRIVEYSTILVLSPIKYTLANVGLHKSWLE